MLFLCELKKIWNRPYFRLFLLVGLVLNFALAVNHCRDITEDVLYDAKKQIFQDYGGTLTREKVNWIHDRYEELSETVALGEFDTSWSGEYYSGYLFGDCNILEQVYSRLSEISSYQSDRDSICDTLRQSAQLYDNVNNKTMSELTNRLIENYEDRKITILQDDSFFHAYLDYRMSSFILIFIGLFLFTGLMSAEREMGTDSLLGTTIVGRIWVPIVQPVAGMIVFLVVSVLFYIEDFAVFGLIYHGIHPAQPLYYIQGFGNTFFTGTVGLYLFLCGLAKGMGIAVFGLLCSFLSNCWNNRMVSISVCFVFLLYCMLNINWAEPQTVVWWNPLNSLVCMDWYKMPGYVHILGQSILFSWLSFIVQSFMGLTGYTAVVISSKRKKG